MEARGIGLARVRDTQRGGGGMIGVDGNEAPWSRLSDEELIRLEEQLYDREIAGEDTWYERDQVLWEINRRGLCGA
jgi:hypothetical protein